MTNIIIGAHYRHYKNKKLYKIIGQALHTETLEQMVVYQACYDDPILGPNPLFVRPLELFTENIALDQHTTVPRFQMITPGALET